MKCIVCNNNLKKKYNYGNEEYCYSCSKCRYEEVFVYGLYEEGISRCWLTCKGIRTNEVLLRYTYDTTPTNTEYRRYIRGLWSYRKLLVRKGIIKGRENNLK